MAIVFIGVHGRSAGYLVRSGAPAGLPCEAVQPATSTADDARRIAVVVLPLAIAMGSVAPWYLALKASAPGGWP
jgi:hypothetical protein